MENPTITAGARPGAFIITQDGVPTCVYCRPDATEAEALQALQSVGQVSDTVARDQALSGALTEIDAIYSQLLLRLTKNKSAEERDTWKPKAAAAAAYLAGTADPGQIALIEREAAGDGTPAADLAALIASYNAAYHIAAGDAGGIWAEAKHAARTAAAADTDLETLQAALRGVIETMAGQAAQLVSAQAAPPG